ncbi:MAG TPA: hypothetical protein VGJ09_11560 [Bryobacteraceae bacterium]|jgi:hypothetical protein
MQLRSTFRAAILLFGIGTASAESHPAWWRWASPEATALVGIQWDHVRSSPFAAAVQGEMSGEGGLGFPQLDCLKNARQILISAPALLAIAAGDFPAAALRDQVLRTGAKRALYHEIEIWVVPGKDTLSIARISDQLMLIGRVKNLQDAIDRSLLEQTEQAYSPLLARAARYSQHDLWVVAARLPDPLAEHFVPFDAEADGFEGGISLEGGLRMSAVFNVQNDETAAQLADELQQAIQMQPAMLRGIQVAIEQNNVILELAVSKQQLAAALRSSEPTPVAEIAKPQPAKPSGPQVIRIYGLDDGPREIVVR